MSVTIKYNVFRHVLRVLIIQLWEKKSLEKNKYVLFFHDLF